MIPLNYHHLYYFWVTAKTGSIARARRELLLAQPTLSLQLKELERTVGRRLLNRGRKGVTLTGEGQIAYEYCERIFSQGQELTQALKRGVEVASSVLNLGVEEGVSREIIVSVMDFVAKIDKRLRVCIHGGRTADLRERLRRHALDIVVSNAHFATQLGRGYDCRLRGQIPVVFVGAPKRARSVRSFPRDLDGARMLLRTEEHPIRKNVDRFLLQRKVNYSIEAEIDDSDLLRELALRGRGVAALNALSVKADLKRGRLTALNKEPTGIKELVWFTAGRRPAVNPVLGRAVSELLDGFSIGV